jgi:hypothetical protein
LGSGSADSFELAGCGEDDWLVSLGYRNDLNGVIRQVEAVFRRGKRQVILFY